MIKDFRKTIKFKKIKNGHFSFFDILQLPHTVISNWPTLVYICLEWDLINRPLSPEEKNIEKIL